MQPSTHGPLPNEFEYLTGGECSLFICRSSTFLNMATLVQDYPPEAEDPATACASKPFPHGALQTDSPAARAYDPASVLPVQGAPIGQGTANMGTPGVAPVQYSYDTNAPVPVAYGYHPNYPPIPHHYTSNAPVSQPLQAVNTDAEVNYLIWELVQAAGKQPTEGPPTPPASPTHTPYQVTQLTEITVANQEVGRPRIAEAAGRRRTKNAGFACPYCVSNFTTRHNLACQYQVFAI